MQKYWFATQDPKVLTYDQPGLWISPKFANYPRPDISVGDRLGIYEPASGKARLRDDGAKALVALATITKLEQPWKQEDDEFWRIATVEITESDEKGIPAREVLKILTGQDMPTGSQRGWYLNRRYAGRVTEITPDQFDMFSQYFSIEEPEEDYQRKVEAQPPTTPPATPQKPLWGERNGHRILVTSPGIGRFCLNKAKFQCEIDAHHVTFISKATGNNYVEAHHLIPLKSQDLFDKALDNQANIVSLCPNCHRLLHHAIPSERRKYATALFTKTRKKTLDSCGTPIKLSDLLDLY